jgi:hypothetical protein
MNEPSRPPEGLLAPAAIDRAELGRRLQELATANEEPILYPPPRREPPGAGAAPLAPAAAMAPTAPDVGDVMMTPASPLEIQTRRALTEPQFVQAVAWTSNIEPSIAVRANGDDILLTANSFAAFSRDGGINFSYFDPGSFPKPATGQPFFCDQVVLYDPARDLMVWYMQHKTFPQVGNVIRLAVAHGDDIRKPLSYRRYDFTPQAINPDWINTTLDFPDIVMSGASLFITVNVYLGNQGRGAVVLRIPLDKLRDYQAFDYKAITTVPADYQKGVNGFMSLRGTRGRAQDTMHFGVHALSQEPGGPVRRNLLHIYSLKDSQDTPVERDVKICEWRGGERGTASAPDPNGMEWLYRVDGRITAAWDDGANLGFAWTAAPDLSGSRKMPHVRVALLRKSDLGLIDEPHLFHGQVAYAYPALATNDRGELGLSVAYGGGGLFPGFAVGYLEPRNDGGPRFVWQLGKVVTGTFGAPSLASGWGDYLWVCEDPRSPGSFLGAGFISQLAASNLAQHQV